MLIGNPLPFVVRYVDRLSEGMERRPDAGLTAGQKRWLSFCLMGIAITESVCWQKFVRAGLGRYSEALLSWYFRFPMTWSLLLSNSVDLVVESFGYPFTGVQATTCLDRRSGHLAARTPRRTAPRCDASVGAPRHVAWQSVRLTRG